MFVGGHAFQVTQIPGREWGISLALGFMSLPIGFLIRCVPNEGIERFFKKMGLLKDKGELPTESPEATESQWNPAIKLVQEKLTTFSNIRGGRLRASSFVVKSRTTRLQEADVRL
jgi:Ca2+-transporting ATPase